jgi:LacI family transcriptional regulator
MFISPQPPTAIIVGANQLPQVLEAVRMLRISIPERLSIITMGDTDVASLYDPALTAVRWNLRELGSAAAELLLSRITGSQTERQLQRIVIPTEPVLRGSCAPPTAVR